MKDPIVEEVRKYRQAHAAKFNYDVDAIARDIREREKASKRRFVDLSQQPPEPLRRIKEVLFPSRKGQGRMRRMPTRAEMKMRVYVETSVISYMTSRPSRDVVILGRQQLTRDWWEGARENAELFVSEFVEREAGQGDQDAARQRLELLRDMPRLPTTQEVFGLARELLRSNSLPPNAGVDALHIAIAAVHRIDVLVTWNFAHIANLYMLRSVYRTIRRMRLEPPIICTPEGMMGTFGEVEP
jgi:predicted nucleic acid-binding protein